MISGLLDHALVALGRAGGDGCERARDDLLEDEGDDGDVVGVAVLDLISGVKARFAR